MRFTFRKRERIRKRAEYQAVYRKGKRYAHKYVIMYVLERKDENRRLGVACPKAVGSPVRKNRVKRLFREVFRLNKHRIKPGVDIVLVGREGASSLNYWEMERIILSLMRRAGILTECWEEVNG